MSPPRGALLGLLGLVAVAVGAPLLASSTPLLARDAHGLHSPWLHALLDPRVFESPLDRAFNALLLLAPGAAIVLVFGASRRTLGVAALVSVLAFVLSAGPGAVAEPAWVLRAPIPFGPATVSLADAEAGPSALHLLGTDVAGRDVLARLLFGARVSLSVGLLAVLLYTLVGVVVGGAAGFVGGRVDLVLQRLMEVVMVVPATFLVLALVAFVEHRSVFHVLALIAAVSWTGPARLVRAEVLRLRALDFTVAARVSGFSEPTILFVHLLPLALSPVLVSLPFGAAAAILAESTLGFLGLGDPSLPSWGQLLAAGRASGRMTLVLAPGLAICGTVLLLNALGESLREALDPRRGGEAP